MAESIDTKNAESELNLRPFGTEHTTERGSKFWNRNTVEMKWSVERDWLKMVRFANTKPNYGMRSLDPILEELTGNKLELVGPILDSFLKEIGKSIASKLGRSRMTGLMAPCLLFVPFPIFKHIMVLVSGYGGHVQTKDGKIITITITELRTAESVWSPARFSGENILVKRHFEKMPSIEHENRIVHLCKGKSMVVVTKSTPIVMSYSDSQQRLTTTFYVQRYDRDGFVQDANLQKLMDL